MECPTCEGDGRMKDDHMEDGQYTQDDCLICQGEGEVADDDVG